MSGSSSSAPGSGAAPDSPLSLTVHSMPSPSLDADTARRTARGRWKMFAVLAVCAAPVIASYLTYYVLRPLGGSTNYADIITPTVDLPRALPLATLEGRPVKADGLRGQWLIVAVADAACGTACEQQLVLQRQLRETLGAERDRVDKVWLVTDDGALRPELVRAVSQGQPVTVLRVPRDALAGWLTAAPGHALADHLYLVDPMGRWMMRVPPQPDPAKVKRDLERLLRASASWDRPGR